MRLTDSVYHYTDQNTTNCTGVDVYAPIEEGEGEGERERGREGSFNGHFP